MASIPHKHDIGSQKKFHGVWGAIFFPVTLLLNVLSIHCRPYRSGFLLTPVNSNSTIRWTWCAMWSPGDALERFHCGDEKSQNCKSQMQLFNFSIFLLNLFDEGEADAHTVANICLLFFAKGPVSTIAILWHHTIIEIMFSLMPAKKNVFCKVEDLFLINGVRKLFCTTTTMHLYLLLPCGTSMAPLRHTNWSLLGSPIRRQRRPPCRGS